ncbi:hypothetical protein V492_08095 [Pseudogymnoascus sp. VKM F-4246]|nr:hypothetical protein V492_08095 [Pseudogymnoascus sp. VKM F-4246]
MPIPPLKLASIEQLPRRLPASTQEDMVKQQRRRIRQRERRIDQQRKYAPLTRYSRAESAPDIAADDVKLDDRSSDAVHSHQRSSRYEGEEIPVVPPPHTVVQPHAVVVVRLDAVIADAAVVAAGRAPDMTGLAVFHGHLHGCAGWEVPREDARVGDGGVDEGGEADKADVRKHHRHGGGHAVPQPRGLEDEEEHRGDDD